MSSVFGLVSSVFCLLSSVFGLLSCVLSCLRSSVFGLVSSVFCLLSSLLSLVMSSSLPFFSSLSFSRGVVCVVCVVCVTLKNPVCRFNTSSCVRSTRLRVFRRARVAGFHGDVLNVHTTTC